MSMVQGVAVPVRVVAVLVRDHTDLIGTVKLPAPTVPTAPVTQLERYHDKAGVHHARAGPPTCHCYLVPDEDVGEVERGRARHYETACTATKR